MSVRIYYYIHGILFLECVVQLLENISESLILFQASTSDSSRDLILNVCCYTLQNYFCSIRTLTLLFWQMIVKALCNEIIYIYSICTSCRSVPTHHTYIHTYVNILIQHSDDESCTSVVVNIYAGM